MQASVAAALLGIGYTTLYGFAKLPYGIGASCFSALAILLLLKSLKHKQISISPTLYTLSFSAALNGLSLFQVTNKLILTLSALHIGAVLLLLLITRAAEKTPSSAADLLRECVAYNLSVLGQLLQAFAAVFNWLSGKHRKLKDSSDDNAPAVSEHKSSSTRGLLWGFLPLILFHLLFTYVNKQYADFMQKIVVIILDPDFWRFFSHAALQSWLVYGLISARIDQPVLPVNPKHREWTLALVPSLIVFLVFAIFQSQSLGAAVYFSFQELSLYVQQGFWQLVCVALLGYIFWALVLRHGTDLSPAFSTRSLLLIFAVELITICVFGLHKVGLHQIVFGLKDTRLAATLGVIVALVTFALCVLHALRGLAPRVIFRVQLVLTSVIISSLSCLNVDQLTTRLYPIRYRVAGTYHPDYAYLLLNSYDNYEDWGGLILKALSEGIPPVKNYYWGAYAPLCSKFPYDSRRGFINNFEAHQAKLPDPQQQKASLHSALRFNSREYNAQLWFKANRKLVGRFNDLIWASCAES